MSDLISRQAAIDALWKALYEYEDKMEKQFQESNDLDVCNWLQHRIFVQNMSDIDRQTILQLPSAQPKRGKWELKNFDDGYGEYQLYVCDQCGALTAQRRNFCYNCGAKMDVEYE